MWKVLRIDEDDYGCEERDENAPVLCIVTLQAEQEVRRFSAPDEALQRDNIDEGTQLSVIPFYFKPYL